MNLIWNSNSRSHGRFTHEMHYSDRSKELFFFPLLFYSRNERKQDAAGFHRLFLHSFLFCFDKTSA